MIQMPQLRETDLKNYRIFLLMAKVQSRTSRFFKKEMKAAGLEISFSQLGVLFMLEKNDGMSMGDFCAQLEMENSAVTRLMDRLEKSGCVLRRVNPEDRRQFLVDITDKGREQAALAKPIVRAANQKILDGLSGEEILLFVGVMKSFLDIFPAG
ncbi:DNA-binding transcriptional regulator, MarR family [Desulfatibacillum alkenivorans DSM 16219]|jgi:DNA-binding MarR family transcriptional regulator|uniref:DNA-binding transcriptional regulator, MarR family n=2 Tax=Desulfatibacillum alkenivorans TaxID=259354 RepID=A0A1M6I8E4_9BACT|nr:DNA-binding transcriptional regulator, MarR family [Desulfatibacillum alkenivorans DSM 16219]